MVPARPRHGAVAGERAALAASELLRSLSHVEIRSTTDGKGQSWSGVNLMAGSTYFEFLRKDSLGGLPNNYSGFAVGPEVPSAIHTVMELLERKGLYYVNTNTRVQQAWDGEESDAQDPQLSDRRERRGVGVLRSVSDLNEGGRAAAELLDERRIHPPTDASEPRLLFRPRRERSLHRVASDAVQFLNEHLAFEFRRESSRRQTGITGSATDGAAMASPSRKAESRAGMAVSGRRRCRTASSSLRPVCVRFRVMSV